MKNKILVPIVFLICVNLFGQQKVLHQLPNFDKYELHWGFYLGLNQRDFKVDYKESAYPNAALNFENKLGFTVGLIGDMRINNNINLRFEPGVSSNSSDIFFTEPAAASHSAATIASTYLHLPILLKFSTNRMNNMKPYLIGGISYDHNFSSKQDSKDDNSSGQFRMQTSNFMYEVGFGVDFYFPYFKFSPSIRGKFAITNELKADDISPSAWTDPIQSMGSRGIFLKFAFE